MRIVAFISLLCYAFATFSTAQSATCGYDSCPRPKDGFINVHLLAHSHMDLGWLKTVDQYFYGTRANIMNQAVQYIYDSVLREVEADPGRRFIFVETGFFELWWKHRSPEHQSRFYDLVQSGRLEFISGGYVMNDEAAVHYSNTIDQMTHGIRILKEIFGQCGVPRIGWQIDPFGHSREYASLLAQMGMDGYFFGRLDYQDKTNRQLNRQMEFIWRGSENLGNASDIFTGILPNTYSPLPGFCFDAFCSDEVFVDDPRSAEFNAFKRVGEFISYVEEQSGYYATPNIPITMGNDFNYQDATKWFDNMDKLIKYTNAMQKKGSKVNVLYSTPSCYLKAVRDSKPSGWNVKTDDFFPYASDPHAFWTGYFTSRPAFKFIDRNTNNWMQAGKQLSVLANYHDEGRLTPLRDQLGISQHHDAVTGTAKQHVNDDYTKRISSALTILQDFMSDAYKKLLGPKSPTQVFCNSLNMSACAPAENFDRRLAVTVFNPLAHLRNVTVRVPVTASTIRVTDQDGVTIPSEVSPIPQQVIHLAERKSRAVFEVVFVAEIPPLGVKSFTLTKVNRFRVEKHWQHRHYQKMSQVPRGEDVTLNGNDVSVTIDGNSGLLKAVSSDGQQFNVKQSFYFYKSACGNNEIFDNRSSGAYIFRPNGSEPIALDGAVNFTVYRGAISEEVRQVFNPWLSQIIRVYKNSKAVEFNWIVGPIPVKDHVGKEIISRFDTNIQSGDIFKTDANGREILERRRNYRPTWNLTLKEPVAGNYYPVNSRIIINDSTRQLTVLTDRSQGGSSLSSGSVELMVHRRCLCDDAFGVGEALNEPGVDGKGLVIRGKHFALFEQSGSFLHRSLAQSLFMGPILSFADVTNDIAGLDQPVLSEILQTNISLPENVHLLTLDMWDRRTILLRLEHFFERKDDAGNNSAPATVSLRDIFRTPIANVEEMKLAVTTPIPPDNNHDGLDVTLTPMQIRTFLVTLADH